MWVAPPLQTEILHICVVRLRRVHFFKIWYLLIFVLKDENVSSVEQFFRDLELSKLRPPFSNRSPYHHLVSCAVRVPAAFQCLPVGCPRRTCLCVSVFLKKLCYYFLIQWTFTNNQILNHGTSHGLDEKIFVNFFSKFSEKINLT
jgi:hypothetical protein